MTKLMEKAIESLVRDVPPEQQDEMARLVMQLTGIAQPVYRLSKQEDAELAEFYAAAAQGEFASDEELRAIWAKHGL